MEGKGKKVYISVPITGHDIECVRKKVEEAKVVVIANGLIPISPLDVSTNLNAPYSEHMGKDITALLECTMAYFLRGWEKSNGCCLEFVAAKIYGKQVIFE